MEKSKSENQKKLDLLVQDIYQAISEATAFADSVGLGFRLDVGYGMGGYYDPVEFDGEASGWYSSSQNC